MLERAIRKKITVRLQLPLMLIIVLSSLDRVNISFAALHMNASLSLTSESFGVAVGLFFVGYLLFQFPSASVQRQLGTRRWMSCAVLVWGLCAMGMAFVHTAHALYVLRFLLGVAESGLSPGIVYYCSTWMPRRFHAGAIAITLLAIPLSVIVGGPLSGWLMSLDNPLGMAGWRWMFLIEGLPTLGVACLVYLFLPDSPDRARWLSPVEKGWLHQEMALDVVSSSVVERHGLWRAVFANPAIWSAAGVWFALLLGSNGIIFWLPQVLKQISGATDVWVGIMSAVPWVGIGCGMILNARHSDLTRERFSHVAVAAATGAVALALAVISGATLTALALLFVGGLGLGGAQGVFWSIPRDLLTGKGLAGGITLVNLVGNLASLVGPYAIGVLRHSTGSFRLPIYLIAAVLLASTLLIPVIRRAELAM